MTGECALKDTYTTELSKWLIDRRVCAQRREGDKISDKMSDKMCDNMCDKICDKTVLYDAAKKEAVGRAQ